jgi:hypothetical protein
MVALLGVLVAVAGVVGAQPAVAGTSAVTSEFRYVAGLLRAQGIECDLSVYYVCGVGTFDGQPAVSRVQYPTDQRLLLDQGCALYDTVEVVTLLDGSGQLTLAHDDALLCGPSPNWLLHASGSSFGNPFTVESTWTVDSGTGVYEHVTGAGTWTVRRWAGGAGYGSHDGQLTG